MSTPDARRDYVPDIHRALPHGVEAEQGVLGSMLVGGFETIDEVRQRFPSSDAFYIPAHQTIYNYLLASRDAGIPTDLITFTQQLRDHHELDQVGGASFLTGLFTFVPTAANVLYYADIVRDKQMLRGMIMTATEAARRAYEEQEDVPALLEAFVGNAIELGNLTAKAETLRPIAEFVPGALQEIEATYRNRGKPIGLATGIFDLDRMIGGLQAPLTTYIGARPAMGKSSMMILVAMNLAIGGTLDLGDNVALFSIEMTGRQLVKRMLCDRAAVDLQRLRDGFFSKETRARLDVSAEDVRKGRLYVDEKSDLSIIEFRARARRAVLKFGCRLIMIDYLQRMRSTTKRAQNSRELEINEIAQGISATAKELNVPIVVLCQLNRENEKRPDKTPILSDIRESGSVEQEARVVLMLHRPAYYAKNEEQRRKMAKKLAKEKGGIPTQLGRAGITEIPEEGDGTEAEELAWRDAFQRYAEIHVVKQNEGPVGKIKVRFVEEFARFENVTKKLFSNNPAERQAMEEDDF